MGQRDSFRSLTRELTVGVCAINKMIDERITAGHEATFWTIYTPSSVHAQFCEVVRDVYAIQVDPRRGRLSSIKSKCVVDWKRFGVGCKDEGFLYYLACAKSDVMQKLPTSA